MISWGRWTLIVCLSAIFSGNSLAGSGDSLEGSAFYTAYPVPPANQNSLFYIQRSKNTNAIVYEVNPGKDGKPDPVEPVKVYWIRYASDSSKADLNYVQKNYAYGLQSSLFNNKPGQYVIHFVSYSSKKLYLLPDPKDNKYVLYTSINGKLAELQKVYLKIEGGTFWFPNIVDVELRGRDPESKKEVVEYLKP